MWKLAFLWAVPLALWTVWSIASAGALVHIASDWQRDVEDSRHNREMNAEMGFTPESSSGDDARSFGEHLLYGAIASASLAGAAGVALLYRFKVPATRKAGWRGWAL